LGWRAEETVPIVGELRKHRLLYQTGQTRVHIDVVAASAISWSSRLARINAIKPDFAICGGDLVFHVNAAGAPRAKQLFDLYAETVKPLNMPLDV
jgi:hypothetical protein